MTGVATMQIKIAFLSSVSSACLSIWRCVATFFSWLYVLLLCYHAFAIVVVVKNKKNNEWILRYFSASAQFQTDGFEPSACHILEGTYQQNLLKHDVGRLLPKTKFWYCT